MMVKWLLLDHNLNKLNLHYDRPTLKKNLNSKYWHLCCTCSSHNLFSVLKNNSPLCKHHNYLSKCKKVLWAKFGWNVSNQNHFNKCLDFGYLCQTAMWRRTVYFIVGHWPLWRLHNRWIFGVKLNLLWR